MLEHIFKFSSDFFLLHRPLKTLTERTSWINRWSRKVRDVAATFRLYKDMPQNINKKKQQFSKNICWEFHFQTWNLTTFVSKDAKLKLPLPPQSHTHAGPGPAMDHSHNASYVFFDITADRPRLCGAWSCGSWNDPGSQCVADRRPGGSDDVRWFSYGMLSDWAPRGAFKPLM